MYVKELDVSNAAVKPHLDVDITIKPRFVMATEPTRANEFTPKPWISSRGAEERKSFAVMCYLHLARLPT